LRAQKGGQKDGQKDGQNDKAVRKELELDREQEQNLPLIAEDDFPLKSYAQVAIVNVTPFAPRGGH
jgi:hypothetical protein